MVCLGKRYLLASAVLASLSFTCLADDTRYWVSVNTKGTFLSDQWKTGSHFHFRSSELEYLHYGRFSQRFLKSHGDKWTLGAHPAVEFNRSVDGGPWKNDYRVELEATGNFSLGGGPTLSTRSRWEFRLREGRGNEVIHRARQLFKLTWKMEGMGVVDSYGLANEVFYELDQGQIVANRFFPVTIGFKSSKGGLRTRAHLMYLSQRSKSTDNWSGSYVIGLDFNF